MTSLVWLRQDLRIDDNPALATAMKTGPTIALYIYDTSGPWPPGGASRWWLHHSLAALRTDLLKIGVPLVLRKGKTAAVLDDVVKQSGATHVFWNRCYEPAAIARDKDIKTDLTERGLHVESFNAALLHEPWTVQTQTGGFYKVYTPFSKACMAKGPPDAPLVAPKKQAAPPAPAGDDLDSWGLLPSKPDWAKGFDAWKPGSAGALQRLHEFIDGILKNYAIGRDRPDHDFTSRLSPHLHFGEISPRQVWHAVSHAAHDANSEKYLKELLWREFAYHLLFHLPHMPEKPLNGNFADFPWQPDAKLLRAWQKGQTGYPIVDAGMRQLWQTGWMHNRVRMIVASLLVKHLLQPWQKGEAWFWDTLVDADLANNAASWQWVAGCGADAAPYFRIFNPTTQGEKFDPNGDYVRAWVPEIAALPNDYIHQPWAAPGDVLKKAGIALGKTYPAPIVDHKAGRERALAALKEAKG
ncbi:MAG: deoxyribodipyrimidine photo-lyase [Bdellovibrionales bacterium]